MTPLERAKAFYRIAEQSGSLDTTLIVFGKGQLKDWNPDTQRFADETKVEVEAYHVSSYIEKWKHDRMFESLERFRHYFSLNGKRHELCLIVVPIPVGNDQNEKTPIK